MTHKGHYARLRRKRALVGVAGFLIGFVIGVPLNYVLYERYINFTTFTFGVAGAVIALFLAEKNKNFPSADEVRGLRFKENLHPLDLSCSDSIKEKLDDLPPS